MRVVTAFLVSCVLWPATVAAAPVNHKDAAHPVVSGTSTWVTRQGSVMVLDIGRDGVVRGYFVNNAPGKGCRGIPYDLNGRMVGETIAFRVGWRNGVADCLTETQWRGHLQPSRNGGLEIVTTWQRISTLAPVGKRREVPQQGTDHFTLQVGTGSQAYLEN